MTIANQRSHVQLTDLQIHLLERSYEWLAQDRLYFSKQFHRHLLRSHPDFVDVLKPISTEQFQIIALTSLTLLIHSVKHPEHIRVISQLLHDYKYPEEKQREMYNGYYESLMNVLSDVAEDSWSPALQGAWKASLNLMRVQIFHCTQQSSPTPFTSESPLDSARRRIHSRVLVVEDDEQIRKTLCSYLITKGYDCYEAENGAVALHYLEGILPSDVVVTDDSMPVLSGFQFLEALTHLPKTQQPPCILCSGNLEEDIVEKARNLGAWAIMAKPYSYEDLHNTMIQAIEANPLTTTLRSHKEHQ
ncbi:MAG: response regulator [Nitrospirales bacterium]